LRDGAREREKDDGNEKLRRFYKRIKREAGSMIQTTAQAQFDLT